MHQERSVLGCIPLLHGILFVFGRAMRPGCHKCSTHERNFTFKGTVQTTESGMKYECYCLIPTSSLATSALSTET